MLIKKTALLVAALAAGGIAVAVAEAGTSHTASGLTTQVVTHSVASSGPVATRSGSVSCPSGSKVTGGGYDATYGGTQQVVENRPSGNGWHVKVLSTGSITIYAVCARLP
jgi:hypothetical protein